MDKNKERFTGRFKDMNLVREHINFKRGENPHKQLSIGEYASLDELKKKFKEENIDFNDNEEESITIEHEWTRSVRDDGFDFRGHSIERDFWFTATVTLNIDRTYTIDAYAMNKDITDWEWNDTEEGEWEIEYAADIADLRDWEWRDNDIVELAWDHVSKQASQYECEDCGEHQDYCKCDDE